MPFVETAGDTSSRGGSIAAAIAWTFGHACAAIAGVAACGWCPGSGSLYPSR